MASDATFHGGARAGRGKALVLFKCVDVCMYILLIWSLVGWLVGRKEVGDVGWLQETTAMQLCSIDLIE